MVRADGLNQINHYMPCKKNLTSYKYLDFIEVMSFNKHPRSCVELYERYLAVFSAILCHATNFLLAATSCQIFIILNL